jgi:hypothetical protein
MGRREELFPRQDQVGRDSGKLGETGPITLTYKIHAESMLKMISTTSDHHSCDLQGKLEPDNHNHFQHHVQFLDHDAIHALAEIQQQLCAPRRKPNLAIIGAMS